MHPETLIASSRRTARSVLHWLALSGALWLGIAHAVDAPPAAADCPPSDAACQQRQQELAAALRSYQDQVGARLDDAARSCWEIDVEEFVHALRDCRDLACREQLQRARLASLHELQPEPLRTRIALPESPVLLAVLGPEADAAEHPSARPGREEGGLVHASRDPERMGIAVQQGDRELVFVPDMDIGGQAGHEELLGLVGASPTPRVRVTGFVIDGAEGLEGFDPARCRVVYQLPPSG